MLSLPESTLAAPYGDRDRLSHGSNTRSETIGAGPAGSSAGYGCPGAVAVR